MKQNIQAVKEVFEQLGFDWVEPYQTTEGAINRKEVGAHTGLYYIYPEQNFYFGKATKDNTVIERHKTHRAKLDVDLASLYSTPVEKAEAKWQFPEGWKEGVCKYLIEDVDRIPSHFVKIGKKRVAPGVLDFPVKHIVDIDTLTVLVWNLDHLTHEQISSIEKAVSQKFGLTVTVKRIEKENEKRMYKVIGKEETFKVLTLSEAMNLAKHMNEFVTIKGEDFEVCGMFGVDSVKDGKCPDGVTYDWNKASQIGRVKRNEYSD